MDPTTGRGAPPSRLGGAGLREATAPQGPVRRPRRWLAALGAAPMVAGAVMVGAGLAQGAADAPVVEQAYSVDPAEAVRVAEQQQQQQERWTPAPEPTGTVAPEPVRRAVAPREPEPEPTVEVVAEGGMGVVSSEQQMAPSSIWAPDLGGYATIEASQEFSDTGYEDLQGLYIPTESGRAVWYSGGAPLAGGSQGTTLVGNHAGYRSDPGVLRELGDLEVGDLLWTRDADGTLQAWAVHELRVAWHEEFPQDYFDPGGVRRLVVTTCGGEVDDRGLFAQNVFAVATPVDAPSSG